MITQAILIIAAGVLVGLGAFCGCIGIVCWGLSLIDKWRGRV